MQLEHRSIVDRVLNARPADYNTAALAHARRCLHCYMRLHRPSAPPPDDRIVAQFLSIAPWPVLEHLLAKRKRPGESYAWFVGLALHQIHGISPAAHRAHRMKLQLIDHAH